MTPGIVAESDLKGATKSEYVFFNGERVARRDGVNGAGGVFYYFSDHLKTASVITDAAGTIKSESDYYPWGGELQLINNDSNHYKFTGKERDTETGLDYFGARYYSNGLGRWVSADWSATPVPVPYADFGDPQSLNLSTYVRNIPTTRIDLSGHASHPGTDKTASEASGCQSQLCSSPSLSRSNIQSAHSGPAYESFGTRAGQKVNRINKWLDKHLDRWYKALANVLDLMTPCKDPRVKCGIVFPTAGMAAAGGMGSLTEAQAIRIQAFADKYGVTVDVVGSRAAGTAGAASDFDYVITGGNYEVSKSCKERIASRTRRRRN